MKKYLIYYSLCFIFMLSVIGCGSDGIVAKGKVTLGGTPIENGSITFLPVGGSGPTAGGPINQGAYSIKLTPGTYRVSILASRVIGQRIAPEGEVNAGETEDILEQYVPEQYNKKTTLTAELAKSNRSLNFDLTP